MTPAGEATTEAVDYGQVLWAAENDVETDGDYDSEPDFYRKVAAKFIAAYESARSPEPTTGDVKACCDFAEAIDGRWLVEVHDHHTCGTGEGGHYGAHEPGCGTVPLLDLRGLEGWAEHEREVKAEALREAARIVRQGAGTSPMQPQNYALNTRAQMLEDRATALVGEASPKGASE